VRPSTWWVRYPFASRRPSKVRTVDSLRGRSGASSSRTYSALAEPRLQITSMIRPSRSVRGGRKRPPGVLRFVMLHSVALTRTAVKRKIDLVNAAFYSMGVMGYEILTGEGPYRSPQ